jgi:SAM-dependent methyltransferase
MISSVRVLKKKIGSIISYLLGYFIGELYSRLSGSKLDLGCGPVKMKEAIGIDKFFLENVNVICDIEKNSLPFKDESFDVIYSSNTLEHILNIEWVMMEAYRVLRKNGHFLIRVPYFRSPGAFQDPTHVRCFTFNTFDYFIEDQDVAPKWYFKKHFKKISN